MVQALQVRPGNQTLTLSGEIDIATAEDVRAMLEPHIARGGPVTVDLSEVTFMDGAGVHVLVDAAEALGDKGCIVVHGAHGSAAKVLDITRPRWDSGNMHFIECEVLVARNGDPRSTSRI
jgi:anti-anti-sigma factor